MKRFGCVFGSAKRSYSINLDYAQFPGHNT